jgi:hypothetical protein
MNSLESMKKIIEKYNKKELILPISAITNNVKCLDFDMDKVVFKSVSKSVKLDELNEYNKRQLDVMDMV